MLVSIITPTFNRETFLPVAIESVLAQTMGDFELIIVDDGSTDNSRAVIETYIAKDNRIKYFYQVNQGQSIARNLALKEAKGDYICFLDSDNYWPADRLAKSLAAFETYPDADIVYGDCITINEKGDVISHANMKRYSGRITPLLLKDNFVSMNTTTSRRKCFVEMGGMSGKRKVADDYDLWLKFSAKYKFQYIPEYLAYYRVMENQISTNKKLRFDTNEKIILDFLEAYPDSVSEEEKKNGLSAFYARKARHFAISGNKAEAKGALKHLFKINPFSVTSLRTFVKVLVS